MDNDPGGDAPANRQLIEPGHGAGDILEAHRWQVLEERLGLLVVEVHLPDTLKNPQQQLFGGFTPTYVDMVSLFTARAGVPNDPDEPKPWLTTINMRCDYFEPIVNDHFIIRGEVINRRGRTALVGTKFFQGDAMAAHALTTIREMPAAPAVE